MNYSKYYKSVSILTFNTFIIFILMNLALFFVFKIRDIYQNDDPVSIKYEGILYSDSSLKKIYPDMSKNEISTILKETWSRPYVYESLVQFKERPYTGKYINVDKNGFRYTKNQGPWPPDPKNYNVFLFGGSTTFGYGVPDDQTIASFLQQFLTEDSGGKVRIYNFGRGGYFSTQERILFEKLLTFGFTPDAAIFIDGLNDFIFISGEPSFTHRLEKHFEGELLHPAQLLLSKLPIYRVADSLRHLDIDKNQIPKANEGYYNNELLIKNVVYRYVHNKKMIEAITNSYGVKPMFVWQPIPMYKYNVQYHLFYQWMFSSHLYSQYGYPYMAEFIKQHPLGDNFLWCADIQDGINEPLYVDQAHYSAKMSRKLASHIAHLLKERNLLRFVDR